MSTQDDVRLMFISTKDFADGEAIRGGMLVTDAQTKPLEFRCTDPVRPTSLQKVLYGKMLENHVLVTLIGKR